ncbi:helix-turn-helix domain-containing protein [Paenibacillus daejeonensis]|uniref:helix-turn-helix domain-containing protein n=1 Tax=Paenibacillus daejeonensis TaxID=135193 RepID=UPI00036E9C45|nr:helix-turn-helix domain-containing protein [Paenibacillus daejeonensis]
MQHHVFSTTAGLPPVLYALIDVLISPVLPDRPVQMTRDYHSIIIVTSGEGTLECGGTSSPINAGIIVMSPPGASVRLACTGDHEMRLWLIRYRIIPLQEHPPPAEAPVEHSSIYAFPGTEAILALVREMDRLKSLGQLHDPLAGTRLLYEMLHQLAQCRQRHEAAQQADAAERIRGYLEQHYRHKIDKERLAAVAGRSRKALPGLFRQAFGQSISEYTNALRIRRAQELMLGSGRKLSEIAQAVGYKDEFYLSKTFKRKTGLSPTVYIKRAKSFATLDHAYTLDFVALGVSPLVAMADTWLERSYPHLLKSGSCHAIDWSWSRPARYALLEQMAPDVIVYAEQEGDDLDRLRRISPVVQIPWQGVDWREHFRIVSELAGHLSQAEAWLVRFEERAAEAREELTKLLQPDETVGILNIRAEGMILYSSGYMGADLLYHTLGLTRPAIVSQHNNDGKEWREVALDDLAVIDPSHLIIAIESSTAGHTRAKRTMQDPLWSTLSSVRQGRAYPVEMMKWYGYGPAAIEAQLEELLLLLQQKKQVSPSLFDMDNVFPR